LIFDKSPIGRLSDNKLIIIFTDLILLPRDATQSMVLLRQVVCPWRWGIVIT